MLTVLSILGVLAVLFVAAAVATREGPVLADAPVDAADLDLPEGPLQPEDLRAVRFALAVRGYRMVEVDSVLERAATELAERDERIASLESRKPGAADAPTTAVALPEPEDAEAKPDSPDQTSDEPILPGERKAPIVPTEPPLETPPAAPEPDLEAEPDLEPELEVDAAVEAESAAGSGPVVKAEPVEAEPPSDEGADVADREPVASLLTDMEGAATDESGVEDTSVDAGEPLPAPPVEVAIVPTEVAPLPTDPAVDTADRKSQD